MKDIADLKYKNRSVLCDLDGVVVQYQFNKIVKNFFGVDLSPHAIFAYDLADVLGVAPILINTMFKDQVYGQPTFIDNSLDTLKEWHSKGYRVDIFSNRVKYMGMMGLVEWLWEYKIPFTTISDGTGNYDFHIDDSPAKLASTNSDTKLLFKQPWNTRCLDINRKFTRVENWTQIKEIIG